MKKYDWIADLTAETVIQIEYHSELRRFTISELLRIIDAEIGKGPKMDIDLIDCITKSVLGTYEKLKQIER